MRILIIGGTAFLGPALIDAARASGHELTLFNRGRSQPDFESGVETVIGDRETDLGRLAERRWDAVIDTCGYLPRLVALSAAALRDQVEHYVFISTLSVYPAQGPANRDESAAVMRLDDEKREDIKGETYGPLKALCEGAVEAQFPGRSLHIRAGLIVGPRDPSNRFTYWVRRAKQGGRAIAPPAQQPIQFIDVRDLAAFIIRLIEAGRAGLYNVTGPARRMSFGELLPLMNKALDADARFIHVSDEFLHSQDIGEFMELPLWIKGELAEGFMSFNIDKALWAGLSFRTPAETIRATYAWSITQPDDAPRPAHLPAAKEAALLNAWRGV